MILMIGLILWILCGIVATGMLFAYLQGEFRLSADEMCGSDLAFSVLIGLTGPLGLFIVYFMTGFAKYGLQYRRKNE